MFLWLGKKGQWAKGIRKVLGVVEKPDNLDSSGFMGSYIYQNSFTFRLKMYTLHYT